MADADPARKPILTLAFYEVFPTPVLDCAFLTAQAEGYAVQRGFEPPTFQILFAHVAEIAWHDVISRAHAGALCVRVSSVERPFVPSPAATAAGAIALELVPAVPGITPDGWRKIYAMLTDPANVRSLLSGESRPEGADLFSDPRPPILLVTLWVRCAAFLLDLAPETREPWRVETLKLLTESLEDHQTLASRALQELGSAAACAAANTITRFVDALANGDSIEPRDVCAAADLLAANLNGSNSSPARAGKSGGEGR